ncbi:MAG: hypothetical protein IBX57_01060 [Gammaproteobacteria bacterium]|nr:hypothetical protein [Gammaproteobacteria bacterium]
MANRKKATETILEYVEKIYPGGGNKEMYETILAKMSDKQFDAYMKKLASGEETLFMVAPNLSKARLSVERNIKIAKELGHEFFQRLWLTDDVTGEAYLTPIPYLVIDLPLRRQAQLLSKKSSIPQNNDQVDELTGQYSGKPRGASLSFPELQTLYAQGLEKTIEELIKFRGGDEDAFRAMNKAMIDGGAVSLDQISSKINSNVKSTQTLSTILKAMHLDNTLLNK